MDNFKGLYCAAPFSSLSVMVPGSSLPCCVISNYYSKVDKEKTITEVFEYSNKGLRDKFLKGDISNFCNKCLSITPPAQNFYHNEMALKNEHIDYINNPTLTNVHLQISSLCNLACRICGPSNSSLLARELGESGNSEKKYENKSFDKDSVFFKSLLDQLSNINFLWFSGGEPLFQEEVWSILEHAVSIGSNKKTSLQLNTNGTIELTDSQADILTSFERLDLHISMDGIDEYAEYIRTNVIFDKWIKNFETYLQKLNKSNVHISLIITVSVFNVHVLDRIISRFADYNIGIKFNILHRPSNMSVRNLSDEAKEYILNKYKDNDSDLLKRVCEFIKNPKAKLNATIASSIDHIDSRAMSTGYYKNYKPFKEIDPEWYNMLTL